MIAIIGFCDTKNWEARRVHKKNPVCRMGSCPRRCHNSRPWAGQKRRPCLPSDAYRRSSSSFFACAFLRIVAMYLGCAIQRCDEISHEEARVMAQTQPLQQAELEANILIFLRDGKYCALAHSQTGRRQDHLGARFKGLHQPAQCFRRTLHQHLALFSTVTCLCPGAAGILFRP
jgi:hypothetical protein